MTTLDLSAPRIPRWERQIMSNQLLEVLAIKHLEEKAPPPANELPMAMLGTVTPSTRQQVRRVARGEARCSRCSVLLTLEMRDDLCFDNGRDAHRSCAETRNREIELALKEMECQSETTKTAKPVTRRRPRSKGR